MTIIKQRREAHKRRVEIRTEGCINVWDLKEEAVIKTCLEDVRGFIWMGLEFHSKLESWSGTRFGVFRRAQRGTVQQMNMDTTIALLEDGMVSDEQQRWPIEGR